MSDQEILEQSYKNPKAFALLFDRHNKRLLSIAKRATGSKDEAEDIVQETFVRIYKHGKKFVDSKGDFRHWSNVIIKNCVVDYLRKREKSPVKLTDEMQAVLESEDEYSIRESNNYVTSVLSKLDAASAEILNWRFVFGKSFKEIARLLNITSGAARVRAMRAKKNFIEIHKGFNIN